MASLLLHNVEYPVQNRYCFEQYLPIVEAHYQQPST